MAADAKQHALDKHREWGGKIEVVSRAPITCPEELSVAYTPGVANPCLEIQAHPEDSYVYTRRGNLVAVVTDGSAVLGLGNIGPEAGMPVMEGKCALFKTFADVDAFPLCVRSNDVDEIVRTVSLVSGSFGGINLEDISAPRCFEIERRLKECCDIPVFHDDQHGTAVVLAAALINALKVTGKRIEDARVVINGAGAAGCAIAKLLVRMGFGNVVLCDVNGIICEGDEGLHAGQEELSHVTNLDHEHGTLADAMRGADAFVGVSRGNLVSREMVASMDKGIVFAMANPIPEIMPEDALAAGAAVVGTGRSDFPNQINNVLVFPGVFRGALDCRASDINDDMMEAAAYAVASLVDDERRSADYVIPNAFDKRVAPVVAAAVAEAARKSGVARA